MNREFIGAVAAIIAAGASLGYVASILRGYTRPHRVTWAVWAVIGTLGVASSFDAGAGSGAYVASVYAFGATAVFGFSLVPKFGKPNAERRLDYVLGALSLAALFAWQVMNLSTIVAATTAVLADAVIGWPTLREAWRQPQHEALAPWFGGMIGSSLALLALERLTYSSVVYPGYIALFQAVITGIIYVRRGQTRGQL